MASMCGLPKEALIPIFSNYLKTETQFDLICKLSHVCRDWRKACMDISLWRKVDGSLTLDFLKKFFDESYWKKVEVFSFSYSERPPSREELRDIYECLPNLKCINFSKVIWMLEENKCIFFDELMRLCPNLSEIILQEKDLQQPQPTSRLDNSMFEPFLCFRGLELTSIDISNTYILGLKKLFRTITYYCKNLEKLKACNMHSQTRKNKFPIESMQNGLKKLKVLRLGSPIKIRSESSVTSTGFPNLEIFTYSSKMGISIKDAILKKLLCNSPNLKVLDIRGCNFITAESLYSLPAANLERLYVSNTKVYEGIRFRDILLKWGHSLVALDVSKMEKYLINHLFSNQVLHEHLKNLQILSLNHTRVTMYTVKLIIQRCPKLNFLDLGSCLAICKSHQHKYRGQTEIRELLNMDFFEDTAST